MALLVLPINDNNKNKQKFGGCEMKRIYCLLASSTIGVSSIVGGGVDCVGVCVGVVVGVDL